MVEGRAALKCSTSVWDLAKSTFVGPYRQYGGAGVEPPRKFGPFSAGLRRFLREKWPICIRFEPSQQGGSFDERCVGVVCRKYEATLVCVWYKQAHE